MSSKLKEVWSGRQEWLRMKKKYQLKEGTLVALFPSYEGEFHDSVLNGFQDFLDRKYYSETLFLVTDDAVTERIRKSGIANYQICRISEEACRCLLAYYCLQMFYVDFIVVSLQYPKGNTVGRLLDAGKLSMDEFVKASFLN